MDTKLVNSTVSDNCCIGNDSDIVSSVLEEKAELGRRNLIRNTHLGKGSYTGTNTIIKNAKIGKFCMIGWNVSIGGGNHNIHNVSMYTDYWYDRTFGVDTRKLEGKNETAENVVIGNDVWIASGVNILNGVTIGDGCVIGAGTIVTKDVPAYSVVVGVPGTVIKKRFSDDVIDALENLKWWEWEDEKIRDNIDLLRNPPDVDKIRCFSGL